MILTHKYRIVAILGFLLAAAQAMGQCVSVASGPWNDPDTWLCGDPGVSRVPLCTDVPITIVAPHIVTITAQQDYDCDESMIIIVSGSLSFANGKKLTLPPGSIVSGDGDIIAPSGGGNSSLIEIGGVIVWNAAADDVDGPFQFPANPQPIDLLSFEGHAGVDMVHLSWTVASELNNDYFAIERSQDLVSWSVVHMQPGSGTSNEVRTYFGQDAYPEKRLMYYRLTQTDFDGTREAFEPIAINFGTNQGSSVDPMLYPNPLNLSRREALFIHNVHEGATRITISDINGHAIQEIIETPEISTNPVRIEINRHAFRSGFYLVKIEGKAGGVQSTKLLID